jgi:hypothetical protein
LWYLPHTRVARYKTSKAFGKALDLCKGVAVEGLSEENTTSINHLKASTLAWMESKAEKAAVSKLTFC